MTTAQLHYDPFDANIQDDPYPVYQQLRDDAPVFRAETANTWCSAATRTLLLPCSITTHIRRSTVCFRRRRTRRSWSPSCR